jgi:GNAT superfamily N-acetyltransferase
MPGKASPWIVEPLGKHHNRKDFSCGHDLLDRYLKEQASQDARRLVAAPFILLNETDLTTILGYYTLSSFGIDLRDLPEDIVKRLPAYPVVPVTLLGRLAIDHRYKGKGAGEFLLVDALQRAFTQSSQIAATAVVVDAIDDQAAGFYRHFGFIDFPDKPGRLFLPIKTIRKLFPDD